MIESRDLITILVAEDDPDDRMLIQRALSKGVLANDVRMVEDGEELLAYLRREGTYSDPATSPRPGLILLDLNMPRLSGREALRVIKSDERTRSIPVVILTTSQAETDILESYTTGANAYVTKPVTFDDLVRVVRAIDSFWFEVVSLP